MVGAYTGLNVNEVLELPVDLFTAYFRAAYIERLQATPEGREYLETAKRLSVKEVDVGNLEKFKSAINHRKDG